MGALALTGCSASGNAGGGGNDGAGAAEAGTLTLGQQYELDTLDPQVLTSVGDKQISSNIYQGLVQYELGGTDVVPGLATKWSHNKSGTTWTFTLRKGVKFPKGYGEFTSKDVVFTFERLVDPKLASPNASLMKNLKSVKADGDYKVVFTLDPPDPAFLDKLASWYCGIVSAKAVKEKGAKAFAKDPIGTGPYQFDHWQAGQETVLKPFKQYWGKDKPKLSEVIYKPVPDPTTMYNAFEAGDLDMIQVTDPDKYQKYKNSDQFQIAEKPGLITRFVGMRSDQPPFDKLKVRQAVTYAINRKAILDGLFKGISVPANQILAPDVHHVAKGITDFPYDPQKAKKLLAEAGYPNGFSFTFTVPNIDRFTEPATVIQQDLAKVGIKAKITVVESQTFLDQLESKKGLTMFTLSRGQEPAPDRVLYTWFHSSGIPANNWARIKDPQIDKWLDEATSTMDEQRRDVLFKKVQQKVADGYYYYYVDHEKFIFAMSDRVKGFVADPLRSLRLDNVSVTDG